MSDVTKTPREELECKKKYLYEHSMFWECNDGSKCQILEDDVCDLLNEQDKEIDLLRLELETHKHPLWSTREAERKVNKLADSLADEVKKNGLLNEEINQLRIENMRLKKKGGDGI